MSIVANPSVGRQNYWGLVQQKGPWTADPIDNLRAVRYVKAPTDVRNVQVERPGNVSGRGNAPRPSQYVEQRVVALVPVSVQARKPVAGRMGGVYSAPTEVARNAAAELQNPTPPETVKTTEPAAPETTSPTTQPQPTTTTTPTTDESEDVDMVEETPLKPVPAPPAPQPPKQKSIYDLSKFPISSLFQHAISGTLDLATGNFLGVGAHIGGAIGDLVKPTGLVPEDLDTNAISNIVSLGGQAVNASAAAAKQAGGIFKKPGSKADSMYTGDSKSILNRRRSSASTVGKRRSSLNVSGRRSLPRNENFDIQMEEL